jgi:hypothetical protein
MKLSPSSEAASCAATREFPNILWNPKFYSRVHKTPPLITTLSQINSVHYYYYYYYLICEAIGTAATPGLLCQPRVIE